jgi:hypothetical protein
MRTVSYLFKGSISSVVFQYFMLQKRQKNFFFAGFSFADYEGLPATQEKAGDDLYEFMIQFFTLFPEYQANEFYVFGESYAGQFSSIKSYAQFLKFFVCSRSFGCLPNICITVLQWLLLKFKKKQKKKKGLISLLLFPYGFLQVSGFQL